MKYIIIPTADLDQINFIQVLENKNTLRYNLDGTKFIVKFKGSIPLDLQQYVIYTHSEILNVITNPINGWQNN